MATMSARYTVIDGEVVAQERGGVRHQLVPDPIGSTVALYDNAGTKTDTFGYWPYGESASRTGTTTAKFQYVGSFGYYQDSTSKGYVRARFLDAKAGRWIMEDPISNVLKGQNHFAYAYANPLLYIDPSGNIPQACCDRNGGTLSCQKICDNYRAKPNSDIGGGGGVICCGSKKCYCVFDFHDFYPPVNFPGLGVCRALQLCVTSHEYEHKDEVICDPKKKDQPNRPPWKPGFPPQQQLRSECRHRRESVECLKKALSKDGNACRQSILAIIEHLQNDITLHCKGIR